MTTLLFSIALIVLAVALIAMEMSIKHLPREIEVVNFELSLLRRQCAEYEHRLTNIEDVIDQMRYYNVKKMLRDEQNI